MATGFGLAKAERIRRRREYDAVFKSGKRISSEYVVVVTMPNRNRHCRLGLVVSKKVGISVVRSRVKRLIREWFRNIKAELPLFDYVVIAKPTAAAAETCSLNSDLNALVSRLKARL